MKEYFLVGAYIKQESKGPCFSARNALARAGSPLPYTKEMAGEYRMAQWAEKFGSKKQADKYPAVASKHIARA